MIFITSDRALYAPPAEASARARKQPSSPRLGLLHSLAQSQLFLPPPRALLETAGALLSHRLQSNVGGAKEPPNDT